MTSDFERDLRLMQENATPPSATWIADMSARAEDLMRQVVAAERAFASLADLADADDRGAEELGLLSGIA